MKCFLRLDFPFCKEKFLTIYTQAKYVDILNIFSFSKIFIYPITSQAMHWKSSHDFDFLAWFNLIPKCLRLKQANPSSGNVPLLVCSTNYAESFSNFSFVWVYNPTMLIVDNSRLHCNLDLDNLVEKNRPPLSLLARYKWVWGRHQARGRKMAQKLLDLKST